MSTCTSTSLGHHHHHNRLCPPPHHGSHRRRWFFGVGVGPLFTTCMRRNTLALIATVLLLFYFLLETLSLLLWQTTPSSSTTAATITVPLLSSSSWLSSSLSSFSRVPHDANKKNHHEERSISSVYQQKTILTIPLGDVTTTTTSNKDNKKNQTQTQKTTTARRKSNSKLYLHIGPEKTGSTYLQNIFTVYHKELAQDNFYYVGKLNKEYLQLIPWEEDYIRPLLWSSPQHWYKLQNTTNTTAYQYSKTARNVQDRIKKSRARLRKRLFQQHLVHDHNVILSAEEFTGMGRHDLQHYLLPFLQDTFNSEEIVFESIHLILVYRNFMEWILSLYHYTHTGTQWWKNEDDSSSTYQQWPPYLQDEREIVSFREYLYMVLNAYNKSHLLDIYQTFFATKTTTTTNTATASSMTNNKWDMIIVNLDNFNKKQSKNKHNNSNNNNNHSNDQLGITALCDVLPDATHACAAIRQKSSSHHQSYHPDADDAGDAGAGAGTGGETTMIHKNTDQHVLDPYIADYERMALEAKRRNLLHPNMSRQNASHIFQLKFQQWSQHRIPYVLDWNIKKSLSSSAVIPVVTTPSSSVNQDQHLPPPPPPPPPIDAVVINPITGRSIHLAPPPQPPFFEQQQQHRTSSTVAVPSSYALLQQLLLVGSSSSSSSSSSKQPLPLPNKMNIIPLLCPTHKEYQQILQLTLDIELRVYQQQPTTSKNNTLVDSITTHYTEQLQRMQQQNQFCNVDIDFLFQSGDTEWVTFLRCLQTQRRQQPQNTTTNSVTASSSTMNKGIFSHQCL